MWLQDQLAHKLFNLWFCQLQIGIYQEHCQWLNNKAFAICLYWDWTPCCYSCWSSTIPEGVQGGVRHSVLQGIWCNRSLDSWMFLGTHYMISILALLVSREALNPFMVISDPQFSCSVVSNSLWPHGLQHARLPCPSPTPRARSTHVHWVGDAIQPSHPLLSPPPPAFSLSQHQGLFQWVSSLHQVAKVGASASASVLSVSFLF